MKGRNERRKAIRENNIAHFLYMKDAYNINKLFFQKNSMSEK
jgi:hypothetical protein